jgi:hypothetical protein
MRRDADGGCPAWGTPREMVGGGRQGPQMTATQSSGAILRQGRAENSHRERRRTRPCGCWIARRGDTVVRHTSPTRLAFASGYVATPIPRFVSLEVRTIDTLGRFGFLATVWRWAFISVIRMETVIHVALKFAGAMKPRASANEAVAVKPFRTVVAGGSTGVRSGVIVTIGTIGGYAYGDVHLSRRFGGCRREADPHNSC